MSMRNVTVSLHLGTVLGANLLPVLGLKAERKSKKQSSSTAGIREDLLFTGNKGQQQPESWHSYITSVSVTRGEG